MRTGSENRYRNESELVDDVEGLSATVARVIKRGGLEGAVKVASGGGTEGMFGEFDDDGVWNGDFADRSQPG